MTSFASKENWVYSFFCKIKTKDQDIKGNLAPQAKKYLRRSKEVAALRLQGKDRGMCLFLVKRLKGLI